MVRPLPALLLVCALCAAAVTGQPPQLHFDLNMTFTMLHSNQSSVVMTNGMVSLDWMNASNVVVPESESECLFQFRIRQPKGEMPRLRGFNVLQWMSYNANSSGRSVRPLLNYEYPLNGSQSKDYVDGKARLLFGCRAPGTVVLRGAIYFMDGAAGVIGRYFSRVFSFTKVCGEGSVPGLTIKEMGFTNRFVMENGFVSPRYMPQSPNPAFIEEGSLNYFMVMRTPNLFGTAISWKVETGNGDLKVVLSGDALTTTKDLSTLEIFYHSAERSIRTSVTVYGTVDTNPPVIFSFSWIKVFERGPIPGFDILVDQHQLTSHYVVASDGTTTLSFSRFRRMLTLRSGESCLRLNLRAREEPLDVTEIHFNTTLAWGRPLPRPRPIDIMNQMAGVASAAKASAVLASAESQGSPIDDDDDDLWNPDNIVDDVKMQFSPNLTLVIMPTTMTVSERPQTLSLCHSCHRTGVSVVQVSLILRAGDETKSLSFYYTKRCVVGGSRVDVTPGLFVPFLSQYYAIRNGVTLPLYSMEYETVQVREEEESTFFYVTAQSHIVLMPPEIHFDRNQRNFSATVRLVGLSESIDSDETTASPEGDLRAFDEFDPWQRRQVSRSAQNSLELNGSRIATAIEVTYRCLQQSINRVVITLRSMDHDVDLSFSFLKRCSPSSSDFFVASDLDLANALLSGDVDGFGSTSDVVDGGEVQEAFRFSKPSYQVPQFQNSFSLFLASQETGQLTIAQRPTVSTSAKKTVQLSTSGTMTFVQDVGTNPLDLQVSFKCLRAGTAQIDLTMSLQQRDGQDLPVRLSFLKACESPKAHNKALWLNVLLIVGSVVLFVLLIPILVRWWPRIRSAAIVGRPASRSAQSRSRERE